MNVNSGKRITVELGDYTGPAGFIESDGRASVSFQSVSTTLREGMIVHIDGRQWAIEKAARSQFLRGYITVELRLVEGS